MQIRVIARQPSAHELLMKKPGKNHRPCRPGPKRPVMPGYPQNRQKDIKAVNKTSDFGKIRILGHSMRGPEGDYGFTSIRKISETIEKTAGKKTPRPD